MQLLDPTWDFLGWKPAFEVLCVAQEYELCMKYQQQVASRLTVHFVH